jgi:hypothetical protein
MILNERLGVPDFIVDYTAQIFNIIKDKIKNGSTHEEDETDESGIEYVSHVMKIHNMRTKDITKDLIINIDIYNTKENDCLGAYVRSSVNIINKKVELDDKQNANIGLKVGLIDGDIDNISKIEHEVIGALGHELFHVYELPISDYHNSMDGMYNGSGIHQLLHDKNEIGRFAYYIYLTFLFEARAHLSQEGINLINSKVKKSGFRDYLKGNKFYIDMKTLSEYSYQYLLDNINVNEPFYTDVLFTDQMEMFQFMMSDTDNKKEMILFKFKHSIVHGIISRLININFNSDDELHSDEGEKRFDNFVKIVNGNKDNKDYFEKWIKKFNFVGTKYKKKMGKLYGHLKENNSHILNKNSDEDLKKAYNPEPYKFKFIKSFTDTVYNKKG